MKKYFLTGLVTLLPLAVTLVVVIFFIDLLTAPFLGITEQLLLAFGSKITNFQHHAFVLVAVSRLLILLFLCIVIIFLGWVGQKWFFAFLLKKTHFLFSKIPVIKTIYRVSRDVTKNFLSEKKGGLFKGSCTVPFPHQASRALGLVAGPVPKEVQSLHKEAFQAVFVPTSPHPISGFLLMLEQENIQSVPLTTEELFKLLVSCGIYNVDEKPN